MNEGMIITLLTGALIGAVVGFIFKIREIQKELDFVRGQAYALQQVIEKQDKLIEDYSKTLNGFHEQLKNVNESHEEFLKNQGIKA